MKQSLFIIFSVVIGLNSGSSFAAGSGSDRLKVALGNVCFKRSENSSVCQNKVTQELQDLDVDVVQDVREAKFFIESDETAEARSMGIGTTRAIVWVATETRSSNRLESSAHEKCKTKYAKASCKLSFSTSGLGRLVRLMKSY